MIPSMIEVLREHQGERTHVMMKSGVMFSGEMQVPDDEYLVLASGAMTAVIPLDRIEAFGFNASGLLADDEPDGA